MSFKCISETNWLSTNFEYCKTNLLHEFYLTKIKNTLFGRKLKTTIRSFKKANEFQAVEIMTFESNNVLNYVEKKHTMTIIKQNVLTVEYNVKVSLNTIRKLTSERVS